MPSLHPVVMHMIIVLLSMFLLVESRRSEREGIIMMMLDGDAPAVSNERRRLANIDRERAAGNARLLKDYFCANPMYHSELFRHRFRMQRHLFWRIETALVQHNPYFVQRPDATGLVGLSSTQKITSAIRQLGYGTSADQLDEYLRLGESTSRESLGEFCRSIIAVFGPEYLRSPTGEDVARILRHSASRGFPGMLGSIDCMHWKWDQCPVAYHGQYQDRKKEKTVILEAVCTYDLHIWHMFFGCPGSMNDLNILDQSHVFYDLQRGASTTASFEINGHLFTQPYYLEGIYPDWPVFVKPISSPTTPQRKNFAGAQEAARKDIKRAFGVLRARWRILKYPSRLWSRSKMSEVMTSCIILHNMIVQDEQNHVLDCLDWPNVDTYTHVPPPPEDWQARFPEFLQRRRNMRDPIAHRWLAENLVEHLWAFRDR